MNYNNIGGTPIFSMRTVKVLVTLFSILILTILFNGAYGQTVKPSDKVLKDTVIRTVKYKLYVGAKGGRYVLKTSKNGNVYKMYIKSK